MLTYGMGILILVILTSHEKLCGACSSSQYCLNGVCTNSNKANCGSLVHACALGEYCHNNVCTACQQSCNEDYQRCSDDGTTCSCFINTYSQTDHHCHDTRNDRKNCGEIGHICGAHEYCKYAQCRACEQTCASTDQTCSAYGTCTCDTGYSCPINSTCISATIYVGTIEEATVHYCMCNSGYFLNTDGQGGVGCLNHRNP